MSSAIPCVHPSGIAAIPCFVAIHAPTNAAVAAGSPGAPAAKATASAKELGADMQQYMALATVSVAKSPLPKKASLMATSGSTLSAASLEAADRASVKSLLTDTMSAAFAAHCPVGRPSAAKKQITAAAAAEAIVTSLGCVTLAHSNASSAAAPTELAHAPIGVPLATQELSIASSTPEPFQGLLAAILEATSRQAAEGLAAAGFATQRLSFSAKDFEMASGFSGPCKQETTSMASCECRPRTGLSVASLARRANASPAASPQRQFFIRSFIGMIIA